ncbi:MAG: uncharacterized protein KVP18_003881 [Porospora cf. gigantea A]|uniref:uncharacterized protein n=1 Tax=Porospora cf. gigantea A TaxID=2853593 RepID=UPI0035598804|nr:MAG: hypothetical protein KVP18_003881 [Porospora cf. gigantea A]
MSRPNMTLLFNDIRQGVAISKQLRHVTSSEKQQRRNSRLPGVVLGITPRSPRSLSKSPNENRQASDEPENDPLFKLENNTWVVANCTDHSNSEPLLIEKAKIHHNACISGCRDVTIHIKPKINQILVTMSTLY